MDHGIAGAHVTFRQASFFSTVCRVAKYLTQSTRNGTASGETAMNEFEGTDHLLET